MTWLYVGTFGSFMGFADALPHLIKTTFTPVDSDYSETTYAWAGPFIGALARWAGGWISDKIGGAHCTQISFPGLGLALVFSGIGKGSTFRQIPAIFRNQHVQGRDESAPEYAKALKQSERESSAVIGFSAAIAAYGFIFIPAMFANFSITSSLWCFIVFYATCLGVCWWFYARKGTEASS